jgi:hypothetical protein
MWITWILKIRSTNFTKWCYYSYFMIPCCVLCYICRCLNVSHITNEITNIPRALQCIQPCRVAMGRIEMTCNCDDIWLQDWLPMPNTSCFDNTIILSSNFCLPRKGSWLWRSIFSDLYLIRYKIHTNHIQCLKWVFF